MTQQTDIPAGLTISPEGVEVYIKKGSDRRLVTLVYRKRDASLGAAAGFPGRVLGDLAGARVPLRGAVTVTLTPAKTGPHFSCFMEVPIGAAPAESEMDD